MMKALTASLTSRGTGTRRRTPLLPALAGLAVLIAGTVATAAPASAATVITGDSHYCDSLVCGSGIFTWNSSIPYDLVAGELSVLCNSPATSARISIAVEDTSGTWRGGTWHSITLCGPDFKFANLSWAQPAGAPPVKAWTIKVQRSGGGIATGNIVAV